MMFLFLIPVLMSFFLITVKDGGGLRRVLLFSIVLIDLAFLGIAFVDLMMIVPPSVFSGTRTVQRIASQGKRQKVEIEIINHSSRSCVVALRDDLPESFVAEPDRFDMSISSRSRLQFVYELTGQRRGRVVLECIHLMVGSPLKLWNGFYRVPIESIVDV